MTQQILTISMITRRALMILENDLAFTKQINREFDDSFAVKGAKIGATLNIRKPQRYIGRTGQKLQVENQNETYVPLTLTTQRGVDISFTSADLELSLDDFSERVLDPAIATIANAVDFDLLSLASQVYNYVGTPGVTPNAFLTYLLAGVAMDNEACPKDNNRSIVMNSLAQATIVDALKGLFNAPGTISEQYTSGNMGKTGGFKFSMDQNVRLTTIGALGGTPVVSGAGQSGTVLNLSGLTPSVSNYFLGGEIIQIAGVYGVNPQNRQSTGILRNFVVVGPVSSSAGGLASVQIYPAITPPVSSTQNAQYQTVNAYPANGALISVVGTAGAVVTNNLAFHKNAFTMASADLPMPKGVDMAGRVSDSKIGLSIRMVRAYDINDDQFPCRTDILYGYAALYPELACRILG